MENLLEFYRKSMVPEKRGRDKEKGSWGDEKVKRVLALAHTLTLFLYPERDLNPHNRNGHRILSPACLPFHHPGGPFQCGKFITINS